MTPLQKKKLTQLSAEILDSNPGISMFEYGCQMALGYQRLGKKEKKAVDESYKDFVQVWTQEFPILGFNDVSGEKIKSIINDTRQYAHSKGKMGTREELVGMFQYVIAYVKRERHWACGKDISTFASKYRSIIYEINHGRPQQTTKRVDAFDYVNNLGNQR